jgi:hypothetical protein
LSDELLPVEGRFFSKPYDHAHGHRNVNGASIDLCYFAG